MSTLAASNFLAHTKVLDMKHVFLVLLLSIGLCGCDAVKEMGQQSFKIYPEYGSITSVFHSDYKFLVGGKLLPVVGSQACPHETNLTCIVVAQDTKSVSVTVMLPTGPSEETWTVEHDGDKTKLWRSDKTPIGKAI